MSTGSEKTPRQGGEFTGHCRLEAARMVIDSGRTIAEVATDLGLGAQRMGKWVRGARRRP